ncbi:ovostatin-like [Pelodytes ibericus]
MGLRTLLLTVTLLGLLSGGLAEPQYGFSTPAMLKSGESAVACINFEHLNETLDVEVTFEYFKENHTIFKEQVRGPHFMNCRAFQVPTVKAATPIFITLVATGQTLRFHNRRSVVIDALPNVIVIQLDRQIYKPAELVQGRVISLNPSLYPVAENDPSGNRMTQWLNQKSVRGIVSFQFQLLSDAVLGGYRIEVKRESGQTSSQTFKVEEFVLPRSRMNVNLPSAVTVLDKVISYNLTAAYTYGQGVPGKLSGQVCRQYASYYANIACNRNPEGICQYFTGELGSEGKFSGEVDLTLFQFDRSGLQMNLLFKFTLTEEGTGIQLTESKYVWIRSQIARVYFDYQAMQTYYKPGIPYRVRMKAVSAAELPLSNATIELQMDGKTVQNLTTAEDGSAEYDIDTTNLLQPDIQLQAVFKNAEQCYDSNFLTPTYSNAYHTVSGFYSRTRSYLQVQGPSQELSCDQSYDIKVQYAFGKEGIGEDRKAVSAFYLVMSQAVIVGHGTHLLDVSVLMTGEFLFSLNVSFKLAPRTEVIVYCMLGKEVIADSVSLSVEKCFRNKVSGKFSEEQGMPGSSVTFDVSAAPLSLCGLRVIDSSLLLLNDQEILTPERVYSLLRYTSGGYYVSGFDVTPSAPPCLDPNQRIFVNGIYYTPMTFPQEGDSYGVFRSRGLVFATNSTIHKPEICGGGNIFFPSQPFFTMAGTTFVEAFATTSFGGVSNEFPGEGSCEGSCELLSPRCGAPGFVQNSDLEGNVGTPDAIETVRTNFPAVWGFRFLDISESGSGSLQLSVPGTITKWLGSGFCISEDHGFGITKSPAQFVSYQPFFVETSLPYSMVRKEILVMNVFVSNYMEHCTKVRVALGSSEAFTAELKEGEQEACICPNQRASYSWEIDSKRLGVMSINVTAWTTFIGSTCDGNSDPEQAQRKDTMIHTVIVKAEGIEDEITYSTLVNVEGTNTNIPIVITPPSNAVSDSVTSSVSVIGDLLGLSVNNLESMIRMPTSCGEQNLATLMPIPSIVKYLNCTGKLTKGTLALAKSYMAAGYMRQLKFVLADGRCSVFGGPFSPTSSWLLALTLWTIEQIKPHVFVDNNVQNRLLLALERTQDLNTGCFIPSGVVFNNGLKGGAENHISFTAYVVAALSQMNYPGGQTLLRGAFRCLEAVSKTDLSLYNRALMFYMYSASGNQELATTFLQQLKEEAIEEDGSLHWERPDSLQKKSVPLFYAKAPSADVEITAYILWGLTYIRNTSVEHKTYMAKTVQWLVKQENAYGGFRSTADTAVALQAFATFGCLVHTNNTALRVDVSSSNESLATFNVDNTNGLLLQRQPLPSGPGQYNIDIQGTGSCLVQVTTRYNLPVSEEDSAFQLSVNTSSESCVNGVAYTYPIGVAISYHGTRNQSNMVIVDIKMPSGYRTTQVSLNKLKESVGKAEIKNDHLHVYLESVTDKTFYFSFEVEMMSRVLNLQPQTVYAYDYYNQGALKPCIWRPAVAPKNVRSLVCPALRCRYPLFNLYDFELTSGPAETVSILIAICFTDAASSKILC